MTRSTKRAAWVAGLCLSALVASGCEITLPMVDCSGIDQPDMGSLTCIGLNAIAYNVLAVIIAALLGLASGGGV